MTRHNDNTRDAHEIKCKVAEYPEGFRGDVADLLNAPGGPEAFGAMIRNARDGGSWRIDHVGDIPGATDHDLSTTDGKVAAVEDLIDMLLRQHPVAREQYVKELAAKLECSEDAIKESLDEALQLRQAHYENHPRERPFRREDPDGEIGMDIPQ